MRYSENALNVFKKLYYKRDGEGNMLEDDPNQVFVRVANSIADNEQLTNNEKVEWNEKFVEMMVQNKFRPCTPCLMNVGVQRKPQTAACFVGGMKDDLKSILDFDREAALTFASGSGIGVNFGVLREKGAALSSGGESSGPFAFIKKLASTGEAVKSGGKSRRAAIMTMFFDDHPDLLKFITLKSGENQKELRSMNLSIAASDEFMKAVENDQEWALVGVVDGKNKSVHKARDILSMIAKNAWKSGDPGVWFIDAANRDNGLEKTYGRIVSTNPCGEICGLSFSACALASINLSKFIIDNRFDEDAFKECVRTGVYFLDFMIDKSGYPTEDYARMAKNTRPIGLGIMGMADMLCILDIPYDSKEAYDLCGHITLLMTQVAIVTSMELGKLFGSFPDLDENFVGMGKVCDNFGVDFSLINSPLRNSNWTTIAPTGTISISADCSPGMEPLFGICYTKNIADSDEKWIFVNPIFKRQYNGESWYAEAIVQIADNHGSCKGIACVPNDVQKVWVTAHDIHWKDRIEMQAHLQCGISNAISSTINLTREATVDDIKSIYTLAHAKGLKGITVYRDGSLDDQPVEFSKDKAVAKEIKEEVAYVRPKIRAGVTYEVATAHGNVFITVNRDDENNVFEVFNVGAKGGNVNSANLEAIGRLISLALQKCVSIADISDALINIGDGRVSWDRLHPDDKKSVPILSIPDAIGQVLHKFYVSTEEVAPVEAIATDVTGVAELRCPECGGFATFKEGCLYCPACGSKCG